MWEDQYRKEAKYGLPDSPTICHLTFDYDQLKSLEITNVLR